MAEINVQSRIHVVQIDGGEKYVSLPDLIQAIKSSEKAIKDTMTAKHLDSPYLDSALDTLGEFRLSLQLLNDCPVPVNVIKTKCHHSSHENN